MSQGTSETRITVDHVAAHCGFSKATVSRVINRDGSVKPSTREKVEKAIAELGYVPNTMASALSGGKSRTVAVLIPDLDSEYYSSLLTGIDAVAEENNYNIILKTRNSRRHLLELANGNKVDAFIVRNNGPELVDHDVLVALKRRGIPYLFIGRPQDDDDCPAVLVDNIGGARQMAHHFAEHGFRRILLIAGAPDNLDSNDRVYGFKLGLSERGLVPDRLDLVHGDFSRESGRDAAREMLAGAEYDAVFAANDFMALGAILHCRERGIRVPEDLAVCGFDDALFAEFLIPSLTTVRQPMFDIGSVAMEEVVRALERPSAREQRIILPTRLQVRCSCGCASNGENHDAHGGATSVKEVES